MMNTPRQVPRRKWTRRENLIFAVLNILPIGLVWLYPLNWWVRMNLMDTGMLLSIAALSPLILVFLFGLPWAIGGGIYLVIRRDPWRGSIMLIAGAAWWISMIAANDMVKTIRLHRLYQMGQEAKPLVAAIKTYEIEKGTPPNKLRDLVPEYLPKIPGTGIPVYPDFYYRPSSFTPPNHWELSVSTSMGLGFDSFLYLPEGNYPKEGYGGILQPLGDWAYVFE